MDMELHAKASAAVKAKWPDLKPRFGAILGSGWAEVVNACKIIDEIPYEAIPGLGKPGVEGHGGRLARVEAGGMEVLIFQGRRHYYEGEGWTPIATPIAILKELGAEGLVLTNAVGAGENFSGADAAASWWRRNFRMYANVQHIAQPGTRVIVIGGQGHTAVMKDLLGIDGERVGVEVGQLF